MQHPRRHLVGKHYGYLTHEAVAAYKRAKRWVERQEAG